MSPDLNNFLLFVKSIEHGGFAQAARVLGIPKSTLSRRMAGLEAQLGVRLIQRSTRQFKVTEIGERFLEHCKAMLVEAEAAQQVVESAREEPCGTIKVTCPIALLHVHIGQALADFMLRFPKVTVLLEATNRRVDVVAEGVDVAIRVRPAPLENSGLILRVLSARGLYLVASPSLIQRFGMPLHPTDLEAWPSLALGQPQQIHAWHLIGPNDVELSVAHHPRYVTSDMIALREAASRGIGVVQLPALMVPEHLRQGRLLHVLPEWQPPKDIIHLVYPSRRGLLPSVRAFVDHLVGFYNSFHEA